MKIRALMLSAALLAGCAAPAGVPFPHVIGRVDPFEIVLDRRDGVFSYTVSCLWSQPYQSYEVDVATSDAAGGMAARGGTIGEPGAPPARCDPSSPLFAPTIIPGALRDGQYLRVTLRVTRADGSAKVLRRTYRQENGGLRLEQP
ncbi:MAG TPA: hypothetical protein VGE07_10220 [Herpetosiphonaceae bacterium]